MKTTIINMRVGALLVTLGETKKEGLLMTTSRDGENPKEERGATPIMIEDIGEAEVIAETEEINTMAASGRGSEDTAGGVSVSEGLL